MKKWSFLILCILTPTLAWGHSGRTDSQGCHNDRKNGGYHCHNSLSVRPNEKPSNQIPHQAPKQQDNPFLLGPSSAPIVVPAKDPPSEKTRSIKALSDPSIQEVGSIYQETNRKRKTGELTEQEYACPYHPSPTKITLWVDEDGVVHRHKKESATNDQYSHIETYYDEGSRMRFVFIQRGHDQGGTNEGRFYFNQWGESIFSLVDNKKTGQLPSDFEPVSLDNLNPYQSIKGCRLLSQSS